MFGCHRRFALAFFVLIVVAASPAHLLACGTIPNLSVTQSGVATWGPAPGATTGTIYQLFERTASNYCLLPPRTSMTLVSTTGALTTTVAIPSNAVFEFQVRTDACTTSAWHGFDTMTIPPTTPTISSAVASGSSVTVTFSYMDSRTMAISVQRDGSSANALVAAFNTPFCTTAPMSLVDRNVPAGTHQYQLLAMNNAGMPRSAAVTVTVAAPPPPPLSITSFSASPSTIEAGKSTRLSWVTQNATSVVIDHGIGSQPLSGNVTITPSTTTTYTLTATNATGSTKATTTVTVLPAATPPTVSVTAIPSTIRLGQTSTLSWTTQNATGVSIDRIPGAQPASGTITVHPVATTTYTVTATGSGPPASASATITVVTVPSVVVSSLPAPIMQPTGVGGGTTSYSLTNAGGAPTTVSLAQNGSFFSQTPTNFALSPGATQVIKITATAQPAREFEGSSIPSGTGVPPGLSVPIALLSTPPPAGIVRAAPAKSRIDVAAPPSASPSGVVRFTNSGTGVLVGLLSADVPWIVPMAGIIIVPAGVTTDLPFTIDRTKRPDAGALAGSVAGNLTLTYLGGNATSDVAPLDTTTPVVSRVTIVDTVQLTVSNAAPPPLAPGEVALFVPGAGHVPSSVGTFISDLSLLNPQTNLVIDDLKLFFLPSIGSTTVQSATVPAMPSNGIALADVVKSVFSGDNQLGTLQIRSGSASKISVNTAVFNTSNPAGTYGTTIPTFRSDHGVGAGGHLTLTGLRQDATGHTNLFIQETSGNTVKVQTQFLDMNGTVLGTRSDTVDPFALSLVSGAVPQNAIAAILTNTTTSGGATFLAYATPVDEASGDNWSVVDWSRQYGYSGSDPVIIPVAGVLQGANSAFFRTDVAMTNPDASMIATGTLRFYPRGGTPVDQPITLGPHQSRIITNVVGSLFGAANGSMGYLRFTPYVGTVAMTSRTYTTVSGSVATFGTHVPTVPASSSCATGSLRAIGSLHDSCIGSITSGRPATFRTNFGMLETSGKAATVRVTLRYAYAAGGKLTAYASAQKDYPLAANEFLQVNGLAAGIVGSDREALGDLSDVEADFQVVSGAGTVIVYTSSTDNGTNDSILRIE